MSVFNLQGSEIIFILLLALVVLGPEKLPSAIKRFAQTYSELRKMGTGFQTELKSALDEPMREMRETAGLIKQNVDPSKIIAEAQGTSQIDAERDAERKMRAQEIVAQRKAEQAATSGPTDLTGFDDEPAVDEWADPIDDDGDRPSDDPEPAALAADDDETDAGTTAGISTASVPTAENPVDDAVSPGDGARETERAFEGLSQDEHPQHEHRPEEHRQDVEPHRNGTASEHDVQPPGDGHTDEEQHAESSNEERQADEEASA